MGGTQVVIPALIALLVSGVTSAVTGFAPPYGHIAGGTLAVAAAIGLWWAWPRTPTPEWTLKKVSEFVLGYSEWVLDDPSHPATRVMDLLDALSQRAALGQINVWGSKPDIPAFRQNIRFNVSEIPSSHWTNYKIDLAKFLGEQDAVTTQMGSDPDAGSYYDLRFDRNQIKRQRKKLRSAN